ncbi:hypothetical protein N9933_03600, partial [bacterium]|nr:hypothetical protein [bacterium]
MEDININLMYKTKSRPAKDFIREYYVSTENIHLREDNSCTILGGPNFKQSIDRLIGFDHVFSYENTAEIFQQQVRINTRYYLKRDDISLIFGDILHAPPTNYMDIDLMLSYKKTGKIIKKLLNSQMELGGTKCFITTLSIRGAALEETLKWFFSLLEPIGWADYFESSSEKPIFHHIFGSRCWAKQHNVMRDSHF